MIECIVTTGSTTLSNAIVLDYEPVRFESRPMVGERIFYKKCMFKVAHVTHVPNEHNKTCLVVEQIGMPQFT